MKKERLTPTICYGTATVYEMHNGRIRVIEADGKQSEYRDAEECDREMKWRKP